MIRRDMRLTTLSSILLLLLINCFSSCFSGGDGKVTLDWKGVKETSDLPITVNFYVENTGSMNGYMCAGSEFKDNVHDFASKLNLNVQKENLFFINSQIIPFKGTTNDYTLNMTPTTFNKFGGNGSSSDLDKMFSLILQQAGPNTVSVFVSDCILGVPYGQTKDYLSIARTNMEAVFSAYLKRHSDLGVEIFCMESIFAGTYYQYGKSPRKISQKRPYYMWVVGPQKAIGMLNKKIRPSDFPHPYKYMVSYSSCESIPFTILNGNDLPSSGNTIMQHCNGSKAHFKIRADLSSTLKDDNFLLNITHYIKKSPLVLIDSVKAIQDYRYTHEISLSIFDNAHGVENIIVDTQNTPSWVNAMSDKTGDDLNKTQGISYIIEGVADAYKNITLKGIQFTIK